jgi:hypothetical protein
MGEFILFLAIFIGIMAVSALIFGGWFIVMIVRGIAGFLGLRHPQPIGPRRPSGAAQIGPVPAMGPGMRPCPYELCKSPNDINAKFCRRCGRKLIAQPVQVRRAAVW